MGSFLRPDAVHKARRQYREGSISDDERRATEDEAIRDLVAKEEDVGLSGITDGEFRRAFFHVDFLEQLDA